MPRHLVETERVKHLETRPADSSFESNLFTESIHKTVRNYSFTNRTETLRTVLTDPFELRFVFLELIGFVMGRGPMSELLIKAFDSLFSESVNNASEPKI